MSQAEDAFGASMLCPYCETELVEGDARCSRCGVGVRPYANSRLVVTSAAASGAAPSAPKPLPRLARQPRQMALLASQVIPFSPQERKPELPAPSASPGRGRRKARSLPLFEQPGSDWPGLSDHPFHPAVKCKAPVAPVALRFKAAALDHLLILSGVAIFLATWLVVARNVSFTSASVAMVAFVYLLMTAWYGLLFGICNRPTFGMRRMGLVLLHFSGRPPSFCNRMARLAGELAALSLAGLGLAWPLIDRDTLSIADHVSETFLTPAGNAR